MKIYRKGESADDDKWNHTDTKPLAEWVKAWHRYPGELFEVNATVKREPERKAVIGIEFEVEDMAALHDAFQRFQQKRIQDLETTVSVLSDKIKRLEPPREKKLVLKRTKEE